MRKVEFRYWCNFEKEMYPKAYVEEHLNLAFMSELIEVAQERYIFLEYTGLKDKNGLKIYDGDILKDEFDRVSQVYWVDKEARFTIREVGRKTEYFMLINHLHVEVIGNIYENPELLKGE